MNRRTALKALIAVLTSAAIGNATFAEEPEYSDYGMVHLPETVTFDLGEMKAIKLSWKGEKVTIKICELMEALIPDNSGGLVYTPGRKDLCE
jgi:hypothetical protein